MYRGVRGIHVGLRVLPLMLLLVLLLSLLLLLLVTLLLSQMLLVVRFLVVCEQVGQLKLHMALVPFVSPLSVLLLFVLLLSMQLQCSQLTVKFVSVVMRWCQLLLSRLDPRIVDYALLRVPLAR